MIRCTFVVVLAILLLIISVSGFFILFISNDCNIFYPYAQSSLKSTPYYLVSINSKISNQDASITPNDYSFFYTSTLCQLTLILFEVMVALVIIFNNEVAYNTGLNNYNSLVPFTTRYNHNSNYYYISHYTALYVRKCQQIFSLKLIFILLISISFLLRLITSTWNSKAFVVSDNQSLSYSSSPSSSSLIYSPSSYIVKIIDTIIMGTSNFSGIIYITSIIEVLLLVLVFSASTRISSTSFSSIKLTTLHK